MASGGAGRVVFGLVRLDIAGAERDPALLLGLLGVTDLDAVARLHGCTVQIEREKLISVDEKNFKLDIFIRFVLDGCDYASLIVEMKKGSAEVADTGKQKSYLRWHQMQGTGTRINPNAFLIVTDAKEEEYSGFLVVRWADICIRLRQILPMVLRTAGIVKASLFVAFISAVERNLLHLTLHDRRDTPFAHAFVAEHLARALQGEG